MKNAIFAVAVVAMITGCSPSPEYMHQLQVEGRVWEAEKHGTRDDVRRAAEEAARVERRYGNYKAAQMFDDIARDAGN